MADQKSIKERVIKALNRVRPYLQNDGGDIDLIEKTYRCLSWMSLQYANS
jgi:Fe-S cluster biogenesis protein NfuA